MENDATTTITGDEIWTALQADKEFRRDNPAGTFDETYLDLCQHLPILLNDDLGDVLTVRALLTARWKLLSWMRETRFIERRIGTHPNPRKLDPLEEMTVDVAKAKLGCSCEILAFILRDVSGWMALHDVDETAFMSDPTGGHLNEASLAAWKRGELTVAGLLATQPFAIIRLTDGADRIRAIP